jgi:hypothetical protein
VLSKKTKKRLVIKMQIIWDQNLFGTSIGLPTLKRENTGHKYGAVDESTPQANIFFEFHVGFSAF